MKDVIKKLLLILSIQLCNGSTDLYAQYDEQYRPQYHFSPQKGWVGDPDGLIFFRDTYHLFWWGHAVSKDLVHWQEMPYPMQGGNGDFHYFSGSVVVDHRNTSGFGDSALVAVYTMHTTDDKPEYQALSYSNDATYFQFYPGNPVLDIGSNSFRDPQVFWYAPAARWIMVAARPHLHQVAFFSSQDLKQWKHLSDFGPMGASSNDWEVPDLFQLPLDGNADHKKWVLSIGQGPNRMQYFLGDFDGIRFIPDEQTIQQSKSSEPALWADYGTDFYAARSWRDEDGKRKGRTTWMGWMGNWSYARDVPTSWGKGFESVPRDLSLKTFKEGIRLVQTPVPELKMLRGKEVNIASKKINGTVALREFRPDRNTYEIEVKLNVQHAAVAGLNLLVGEGRKLVVGYDKENAQLFIDRTNCTNFTSNSLFNQHFAVKTTAPLQVEKGIIKLHILVDQSSVEVFANDGQRAMSVVTFPGDQQKGIELFAQGGQAHLISFKGWTMKSIWK